MDFVVAACNVMMQVHFFSPCLQTPHGKGMAKGTPKSIGKNTPKGGQTPKAGKGTPGAPQGKGTPGGGLKSPKGQGKGTPAGPKSPKGQQSPMKTPVQKPKSPQVQKGQTPKNQKQKLQNGGPTRGFKTPQPQVQFWG